ncbi:hypothetical protein QBC35DRAFT_299006 [Podospora australis]|uniref:3'(2'),5'-bisphosphate nucleotidase n=1 Tax=Podospora australis TaxID=1536484 RepID=A0AAN6WP68_9PEZI|nr:hypothetical protein QBC35DRAFT_299006 [Podospora australis]
MTIPRPQNHRLSELPQPQPLQQQENHIHDHHQINHNPLAMERLIAELAVQRAALLTKHVLRTLDNLPPPSPTCVTPINGNFLNLHFPWQQQHPSSKRLQSPSRQRNSSLAARDGRRLSIAKSDASPVTIADFAAQALLISAIHHAFPADGFVGEEDSHALRQDPDLTKQVWELVSSTRLSDPAAEALLARPNSVEEMFETIDLGGRGLGGQAFPARRFWAMDPIDGTSAFLKGGQYAVSLALIDGGKEVLGVLGCPNLPPQLLLSPEGGVHVTEEDVDREGMGLMLSAVRGQGSATARPMTKAGLSGNTTIIQRDAQGKVDAQDLHFVDSTLSTATISRKVQNLALRVGARYPGTEIYSSHMRYATMVLGSREHTQVRFPVTPSKPWCLWDHAGSQLIYTESGAGKVTDLLGRPIDFGTGRKLSGNWGLITADESVHDEILDMVTEMLEEEKLSSS